MKTTILSTFFIILSCICFSQNTIDWSSDYELELSDFKSTMSEVNSKSTIYSIQSGATINFSFHMSSIEFLFIKNFNSKVITSFNKSAASIIAPDSVIAHKLLKFGQYDFDLTELFSRKFRKELYEKKEALSKSDFFQPLYDKFQAEMNERSMLVLKESEMGLKTEVVKKAHLEVLEEIEKLSEFCKECKPPKKPKKKRTKKRK